MDDIIQKRIKKLIVLLIVAMFMWVAAGIVTTISGYLLYQPPQPQKKIDVKASRDTKGSRGESDYKIIIQRDMFEVAKKTPEKEKKEVDPDIVRPLAEMGITLKGTITGPEEVARAVIEEKNKQESYKIGDSIKGAKVLAIYRNKVIMDVNGQEQMLVIEEGKSMGRSSSRRRSPVSRDTRRRSSKSPVSGMANIMQNLDQYIGRARVVPYFKKGEPYGFRISNVSEDAMIYEMGVRSGDVIRSVNGKPVRTPEDAFALYQELQSESSVDVELERKGSSTTITVPLQ